MDVYTSERISEKEFVNAVFESALHIEQQLNLKTKMRWHCEKVRAASGLKKDFAVNINMELRR